MTNDQPFQGESPDILALIPVHAISGPSAELDSRATSERAEAKERVIEECKRRINLEMLYTKLAAE
jgi:hypothetical protein